MKDCDRFQELISDMMDGELSEPQKTELEAHIKTCRDCARIYDAFAFISLSIDEGLSEPPESLCADIMEGIRLEGSRAPAAKKRPHILGRLAALAACLAIVVFAMSRSGGFPASFSQSSKFAAGSDRAAGYAAENAGGDSGENGTDYFIAAADATATPFADNGGEHNVTPSYTADTATDTTTDTGTETEKNYDITGESTFAGPDTAAALLGISKVTVFSGEQEKPDPEPIIVITDEESLVLIMDLLAFSEAGDELEVSGAPVFMIDVTRNDDSEYSISVWIVDGRLCCVNDDDGVLYVAAGDASDLFSFIAAA